MSTGEDTEGAGGNGPRSCAPCNYLRKSCAGDCILAPHFPDSDPWRYECVRRLFGRDRVARVLEQLPAEMHGPAADSFAAEALWRAKDPVYGCAGVIHRLQEKIGAAQCELAKIRAEIAMHAHYLQLQQDHQEKRSTGRN